MLGTSARRLKVGLINWLKDKIILQMEHDIKMLQAEIKRIDNQLEGLDSKIISVRQRAYKQQKTIDEDEGGDIQKEIAQMKELFGGSLPIEIQERLKRMNNS